MGDQIEDTNSRILRTIDLHNVKINPVLLNQYSLNEGSNVTTESLIDVVFNKVTYECDLRLKICFLFVVKKITTHLFSKKKKSFSLHHSLSDNRYNLLRINKQYFGNFILKTISSIKIKNNKGPI